MFNNFSDIFSKLAGRKKPVSAAYICELFRKINKEYGYSSKPIKFINGTLYISSNSSLEAQNLYIKKEDILETLNKNYLKIKVKDIKFTN